MVRYRRHRLAYHETRHLRPPPPLSTLRPSSMLHNLFSAIDDLTSLFGIEKIETARYCCRRPSSSLARSLGPKRPDALPDSAFVLAPSARRRSQIGDAYVAAVGCVGGPSSFESPAANARRLARMAVGLQTLCAGFLAVDGTPVKCRVGLHAGPVTAGIVGTSMLR